MLTWVVAAANAAGALDTRDMDERVLRAERAIPWGGLDVREWMNDSGRLRLWTWDRKLATVPSGPCVDVRQSCVLALCPY